MTHSTDFQSSTTPWLRGRLPRGRPGGITLAASLWAAFQVSACESATEPNGSEPEPTTGIEVSEVSNMVPGGRAEVSGKNLDEISRLVVDDAEVTFEALSSARGEFDLPRTRDCETDGRRVTIEVNDSISEVGQMEVDSVTELEVGESRVLSADEYECLKLGRGMEHYVLSVADFRTDHGDDVSPYKLVARGSGLRGDVDLSIGGEDLVESEHAHSHSSLAGAGDGSGDGVAEASSRPGEGPSEGQFDDYAGAEVGDTVKMVDWLNVDSRTIQEAGERDEVPTYDGIVAAVEGRHIVILDTNSSLAVQVLDNSQALENLRQGAKIADELTRPAVRSVFGPDFDYADGAEGRIVTLVTDLGRRGGGVLNVEQDVHNHRWASGMATGLLDSAFVLGSSTGESLARVMIHEFGHAADAYRRVPIAKEMGIESPRPTTSVGFYREAVAVTVEDAAARLAQSGQLRDAPEAEHGDLRSGLDRIENPLDHAGENSPWGEHPSYTHPGWYERGAQLVRYAQLRMEPGEEWRLHDALVRRDINADFEVPARQDAYSIASIAEEVGETPREILENTMLADLTDGLVDREAGDEHGLPQVPGWAIEERDDVGEWIEDYRIEPVDRVDARTSLDTSIPAGGYGFRYIPGHATRGISLEVEKQQDHDEEVHEVRLTRLR